MRFLFFIMSLVFLFSCTENDKKLDIETNTFYSKYLYIYTHHDSIGLEKSINLLDEYIKEFPNAQNAYIFKAWLLAENNNFEALDTVFSKALINNNENVELYAYWSSLLLKDSTRFTKAQEINQKGFNLAKDNIKLQHNKTWIHLFKEENTLALENALKVCKADTLNLYLYNRAALIASIQVENDSVFNHFKKEIKTKEDSLHLFLFDNKEMSLLELYNKRIDK